MGSNEAEQRILALLSFGTDFREPGRDDADGPDSGVEDRFDRLEHHRRRDTDDGEIDRIGNVGDGAVATHPCDGLAVAVDGVRRARELAVQDVAKSSPPIVPRREEAPSTATDCASKNGRSDATTAVWSRASTREV